MIINNISNKQIANKPGIEFSWVTKKNINNLPRYCLLSPKIDKIFRIIHRTENCEIAHFSSRTIFLKPCTLPHV